MDSKPPEPAESQHTSSKPPSDPDGDHADRALMVLIIAVLIAIPAWFLVQKLSQVSKIQDCVMSGRKNCAPIEATPSNEK